MASISEADRSQTRSVYARFQTAHRDSRSTTHINGGPRVPLPRRLHLTRAPPEEF